MAVGTLALFLLAGAAFSAADDVEDLMLLSKYSNDAPVAYGFIEAKKHVKFWLHAKGHEGYENIKIEPKDKDRTTRANSRFDPSKKTKVIIHGWMVSGEHAFCKNTREAYLKYHDYNVITVDWSSLSSYKFYPMSVVAIYYVGPYVGKMLDYLATEFDYSLDNVHLIGHSLGAHVAGLAGAAVKKGTVARITEHVSALGRPELYCDYPQSLKLKMASKRRNMFYHKKQEMTEIGLDPAGPPFTILDKKYKLDTSHAKFVDIIHTSIVGHGKPMGHADFYPNGGGPDQPGCKADIALCTHRRAHQLFTESISDQASFPAMTCDDWLSFLVRNCSTVPNRVNMGEYLSNDARGVYYLATNEKQPYTKLLSEKLKIPEYYNPSDDMFSVFE